MSTCRSLRSQCVRFVRFLAGVVMLSALLAFASKEAHAEAEPIAIRYEASRGCPSEEEFLTAVRAYTTRWTLVPEGTGAARSIRVRVSAKPSPSGSFAVANVSGVLSERKIQGPTCTAVSRALAVMVAVAIDPHAGAPEASSPPTPNDAPNDAANDGPHAIEPPAVGPPPAPHPIPPIRQRRPPATAKRATTTKAFKLNVGVDLRVETNSAVVRGALPGIGASLMLELEPAGRGLWWPSLGVGMRQSLPKERSFPDGSVEFLWTAGDLRLCPLRIALGALAAISPCVETNIGVLHATAEGFTEARRASTFWIDVGGSAWFAVSLTRHLFLSSTLMLTVPLIRRPFTLDSGASVASVPPRGVLGGVGLGAKF